MEIENLHEFDDVWNDPRLVIMAGAYNRAWGTFGGSQEKSEQQKQKILSALLKAVEEQAENEVKTLSKILELGYAVNRNTLPTILIEHKISLQKLAQASA